jgi:hypothetical protein
MSYSTSTLTGVGHQWTIPTTMGHFKNWFSQWEPMVVISVGTQRSLVTHTNKCGWAISKDSYTFVVSPLSSIHLVLHAPSSSPSLPIAKLCLCICLRATSHMRPRARDHYTSSTLVGGKGRAGASSIHTTLEGPTEYVNARWM